MKISLGRKWRPCSSREEPDERPARTTVITYRHAPWNRSSPAYFRSVQYHRDCIEELIELRAGPAEPASLRYAGGLSEEESAKLLKWHCGQIAARADGTRIR